MGREGRGRGIYGIVRMCVPNGPLGQVYDWPPFSAKSI